MWDESVQQQFRVSRLLAIAMLIAAPVAYLIVTFLVGGRSVAGSPVELVFYLLLAVAIFQPAAAFLIERFQFRAYTTRTGTKMSPPQLLFMIGIIKYAMVEAVYIYGFVVYFIADDLIYMAPFYCIGVVWSYIHWPRRERWERTIESLEKA